VVGKVWKILVGLGFFCARMREMVNVFRVWAFGEVKNVLV
jgi:hypothetical protein